MSAARGSEGAKAGAAVRSVARVVTSARQTEGAGFVVRRPFPSREIADVDPFLLLDHLGPTDYGPGEAVGAPDHPHRGFETVTYLLEGRMEHKDSQGNSGKLGPGDIQWMTAGAGVVHSEMPEKGFLKSGGRMHGFQLWVNLPARDKMIRPRYQDTAAERIPSARTPDGSVAVRVVAGEALGARAVIETRTPILYLHYTIRPGGRTEQPVPREFAAFAYVIRGVGLFGAGDRTAAEGQMALFAGDGDTVTLSNPAAAPGALDLLLIGGLPLREPVARYGPFVMNTREEIEQAFEDYRSGRMGRIGP
jgi:quercetin 2,3-dioxygenase